MELREELGRYFFGLLCRYKEPFREDALYAMLRTWSEFDVVDQVETIQERTGIAIGEAYLEPDMKENANNRQEASLRRRDKTFADMSPEYRFYHAGKELMKTLVADENVSYMPSRDVAEEYERQLAARLAVILSCYDEDTINKLNRMIVEDVEGSRLLYDPAQIDNDRAERLAAFKQHLAEDKYDFCNDSLVVQFIDDEMVVY